MHRWIVVALLWAGCSPGSPSGAAPTGSTGDAPGPASDAGYDAQLSEPLLSFAAVGDTRPSKTCKTAAACTYPSRLIGRIFGQIQATSPAVPFVVSTGDYQYNAPGDGTAAWQVLQQYLPAARLFRGPVYPAMGNHECNGYTDSNCLHGGPLPCDGDDACGITENLAAFLGLLGSMGLPSNRPYYSVGVSLAGGLTAKFVVTAPNAWDSTQAAWLEAALARTTTYTFVVQHEPNDLDETGASHPASLPAIRAIVQASGRVAPGETYPVTLWIVGHTHNFDYDPAHQQVVNGLGGAPTDGLEKGEDPAHFYRTSDGAYLLCRQQASGNPPAVQCVLTDSKTNAVLGTDLTFAVNADGTPAAME